MYIISDTNWKLRESAPYKLLAKGAASLSDVELLRTALEISLSTARRLLDRYASLKGLSKASIAELCTVKGLSKVAAIRIVAAFELARRKEAEEHHRACFKNAEEVANYLRPRFEEEQREIFRVLYFSRNNELLADKVLFMGGISSTIVDVRMLVKEALHLSSSAILVAHNHPSQGCRPSQADITITQKIKKAAELFEIKLLDHLIITDYSYYSFHDEGAL